MERKARARSESAQEMSATASRILNRLLPEWQDQFLKKNAGYGDMSRVLGARAQFVDIHRKVGKLQRALWDDQQIGPEDVREVTLDLVGHCFLLLDLLTEEAKERS